MTASRLAWASASLSSWLDVMQACTTAQMTYSSKLSGSPSGSRLSFLQWVS